MLRSLAAHLCAEILELSLTQLEAIRLENYQTRKAWKAQDKNRHWNLSSCFLSLSERILPDNQSASQHLLLSRPFSASLQNVSS